MHDEEGFIDVMPPGDSSGVASSIQRDDEVSKVLLAGEMNQTIRSSGSPFIAKQNETVHDQSTANPNATLAQNADSEANRTDGDILFQQNRKEALSFGTRDALNLVGREEAPGPSTGLVRDQNDAEDGSSS